MQTNLSIIILAAGAGTRMKSSTPKVLHKISGKEMLYYSIFEAKKLSDDIHVVLYHQASLVQETMQNYFDDINYVIQDHINYPGTGGAVMNIDTKYNKTLVLNGDMPLIEAKELLQLTNNDEQITMSVLELDDADGYGRVIIENNSVVKIVEQKDCNESELTVKTANAGIYCFDTNFLQNNLSKLSNNNAQKEYYLTDLISIAVSQNIEIKPIVVKEQNFKGVNSKLDLANAEVLHQDRIKNKFLQNGVIMRLPSTIFIEDSVTIEGESILENGVALLGNTKIINSHIKAHTIVESSIISNSDIGPMARIRPESILENTHIGNFVETKKAELSGVKAGHLSYLGDCSIDRGTNIGAGSITCNYDGKKKSKTIIGKNVFIGSNTKLIAPIILEDDCMTAAGSTIDKRVESGDLAIERSKEKQRNVKNFFYKFFSKKA